MANTPEIIRELSRALTLNEVLLAAKELQTKEEIIQYIETLLKGLKTP